MNKLTGFIQSGIIFIGDPVYMSGDIRDTEIDLYNPFKNWDVFTQALDGKDATMAFPGSSEGDSGRGVAVQTGLINGKYEITKEFDEAGALSQILIKILP